MLKETLMSSPPILSIKRMEDLHTGLIGRCEAGQFFIVDYPPSAIDSARNDLEQTGGGKAYVVRYLFSLAGEFIHADHTTIDEHGWQSHADEKSAELLAELEPYTLCDIAVKLFQTTLDGVVFGLIFCAESNFINLEPGSLIAFGEPWDGEYYT